MRIESISKEQLRKIALPLGASVVAAAGTMFVPTALLETITGATGLSELVPATAAPLGDTARALIAFGAGAFTLAISSLITLRSNEAAPRAAAPAPMTDRMDDMQTKPSLAAKPSLADRIGNFRMPQIKVPKMPWIKGEGDVMELSDLPRIRNADAHPDAPSRRPLVATEDLPTLELTSAQTSPVVVGMGAAEPVQPEAIPAIDPAKWYGEIAASTVPEQEPAPLPSVAEPVTESAPLPLPVEEPAPEPTPFIAEVPVEPVVAAPAPAPLSERSLDDMLAQFEAAIARRQAQVAVVPVEMVAAEPAPTEPEPVEFVQSEVLRAEPETPAETPVKRFATPLSAIPSANKAAEEMDSALAAALATLQRMNGTSR